MEKVAYIHAFQSTPAGLWLFTRDVSDSASVSFMMTKLTVKGAQLVVATGSTVLAAQTCQHRAWCKSSGLVQLPSADAPPLSPRATPPPTNSQELGLSAAGLVPVTQGPSCDYRPLA